MKRRLVVLVADDDERDLQVLRLAMTRNGVEAEVHEVRDGEDAVDYLRGQWDFADRAKHPFPDLLVVDLKMQKMGGLEVLEWLQKHPECKRLPTIMLSGSGLEKDVEEAYRRGVATYFAKPTSFKEFQELIKTVVEYWARSERPKLRKC
jgi:CheY-like chemotaxis protein